MRTATCLSRISALAATQALEVTPRDPGRRGSLGHRAMLGEQRGDVALLELLDHAHARQRQRQSLRDDTVEKVGLRARWHGWLVVRCRTAIGNRAVEIPQGERS